MSYITITIEEVVDNIVISPDSNEDIVTVTIQDAVYVNGASAIHDLTDVDTSTSAPSIGDVLGWDGTDWVPATPSGITILNMLGDMTSDGTTDSQAIPGLSFTMPANSAASVFAYFDGNSAPSGNILFKPSGLAGSIWYASVQEGRTMEADVGIELTVFGSGNFSGGGEFKIINLDNNEITVELEGSVSNSGSFILEANNTKVFVSA